MRLGGSLINHDLQASVAR